MSGVTGPGSGSHIPKANTEPNPSQGLIVTGELINDAAVKIIRVQGQEAKENMKGHDVTQLPNAKRLHPATKAIGQVGKTHLAHKI